jgi:hypothetical protein
MAEKVTLLHAAPRDRVRQILESGLRVESSYFDLGLSLRQGVVYCWLSPEDDKMSAGGQRPDHVYLEVEVDQDRCTVADMDFISLAQMYAEGLRGRPRNPEAARLLAAVYEATAVPLSRYAPGMFFTPEVLVKGDVTADAIRPPSEEGTSGV